jgi:hypothetical protein
MNTMLDSIKHCVNFRPDFALTLTALKLTVLLQSVVRVRGCVNEVH